MLPKVQSQKVRDGWRLGLFLAAKLEGAAATARRDQGAGKLSAAVAAAKAPRISLSTRRTANALAARSRPCQAPRRNGYFTPYRANSSAISVLTALAALTSSVPVASPFFNFAAPRP